MDKYAVDLDQLLNDFEYSELRDSYPSVQPRSPPETVVKHSINNVFHSLNEYLNTDITPKVDSEVKTVHEEKDSHVISEENKEITADNNIPEQLEEPEQTQKIEELKPPNIIDAEIEKIASSEESAIIETLDSTNVEDTENTVISQFEENVAISLSEENVDDNKEDVQESKVEEKIEDKVEEEIEVDIEEIQQIDNEDKVEEISEEISHEDKKIEDTQTNDVLDDNLSINSKTEDVEVVVAEQPNVVSFDNCVEDDKELLSQMLDNLEDELSRPDNLPINGPTVMDPKEINLVGGPGSTPYNNVYKDLSKESDSEYSTSASPTFSDASTSDTASTCSADNVPPTTPPTEQQKQYKKDPRNKVNLYRQNHGEPKSEETTEAPTVDGGETSVPPVEQECTLGKKAPYWMPDEEAEKCLHCEAKFTVIKRRHHCRACGKVLCSKCCNLKYKLSYLDAEARVCAICHQTLLQLEGASIQRPNPNNPAEYCSTVSPLEQVGVAASVPPSVMVPVGVLKRKGSNKVKHNKTVMFCDGIRPGSDLTNLDNDFNYSNANKTKSNIPQLDPTTKSFIPDSENDLPPIVTIHKTDISYTDCQNGEEIVERLRKEQITFALNLNLYIHLKIVNMDCCVNKTVWCFSTEGLINVGQDEIVILLEIIEGENQVPKDMFYHINSIHLEASKGSSVKELGLSLHNATTFLDSKNHAGFVFIKPSFQCLQNIIVPKEPYLVGILIHKWETPWAKLFPLRLVLRFGALYRYYPSPIISTRRRDSVFVEIGHTIINLLADFRNYSYTLPQIRGLTIHMEEKNTTITIPSNRYDQVMKSVSNSTDHILAFAGNFSQEADSHLVCIQDTQDNENSYTTHAINIHNKPRKITGASFIVFNGALKSSSGLTAKSTIVEDGLMIQVLPEHMLEIRESLRAMKNHTIQCGVVNSTTDESECVHIVWGENDVNFNAGILSPIDNTPMSGVPSIRVHNAKDYICNSGNRLIRWTEVFIIQNNDDSPKNRDPVDISKVSESIAKATCSALVKYLDLLVTNNFYKIGIRTNLHIENVSYLAGSNNTKLPPIYMKSLDNELIPVLHRITSNNLGEHAIVIELIFRILNTVM